MYEVAVHDCVRLYVRLHSFHFILLIFFFVFFSFLLNCFVIDCCWMEIRAWVMSNIQQYFPFFFHWKPAIYLLRFVYMSFVHKFTAMQIYWTRFGRIKSYEFEHYWKWDFDSTNCINEKESIEVLTRRNRRKCRPCTFTPKCAEPMLKAPSAAGFWDIFDLIEQTRKREQPIWIRIDQKSIQ